MATEKPNDEEAGDETKKEQKREEDKKVEESKKTPEGNSTPSAEGLRHRQPSSSSSTIHNNTSNQQNFSAPGQPAVTYESSKAYAEAVRQWLWAYHSSQMAQNMAPFMIHSALMHQIHQQQQQLVHQNRTAASITSPASASSTTGRTAETTSAASGTTTSPGRRRQAMMASYGRRLIAEMIDFCFCFILKLFIVYFLVEIEIIDLSKYEKLLGDHADLKTFIDVTQDLFPIEIANKVIASLVETFFLSYGWMGIPPGYTPGKFLMGIKVVQATQVGPVAPRDNHRFMLTNAETPSFFVSLLRSLVKNFLLSFLFPLCIIMYAFKWNRSFYDLISGTVVIESQEF